MYTSTTRVGESHFNSAIDTSKLAGIFGYEPRCDISNAVEEMSFVDGQMVVTTGTFLKIVAQYDTYTISPSKFHKTVGFSTTKGKGSFEGPCDDFGKKLINLYFANHKEGSTIYLNEVKHKLQKKDGVVELVKA